MDHQNIADDSIVDRYLVGDLSSSAAAAFESHYLSCKQCVDELADTLRLRESLQEMVNAGDLALPARRGAGNLWQSPVWAAAASLLLAVSVVSVGALYLQDPAPGSLSPAPAELFTLASVRGGPREAPANTVQAQSGASAIVLLIDTGHIEFGARYSVTIAPEAGSVPPLSVNSLAPGFDGQVAVSLPASHLLPGDYRVEIREHGSQAVLETLRFSYRAPGH